jgi:RNA polymerase sigma-B factor
MAPTDPEALVLEHRRLACTLAQRYLRGGEPREDLEQVAYLGLVKAAQRFDSSRGVAFTTFAVPTVLGELRRHCRDTRWCAHVPRTVQEQVQALRRFEDTYAGRSPSVAEAAKALGWPEEDVLEARLAAGSLRAQSLNARLVGDDGTIGEAIDSVASDDLGFASTEQRDELQHALATLTDRERRALRLRGGGCSTPQIASRLGLSTSQASRLVNRAARRLRTALDGEPTVCAAPAASVTRLADADPELFAGVDSTAVVRPRTLTPGPWGGPDESDELGLLVLEGALLRSVTLEGRPRRAELLGPGDVIHRAEGEPDATWRVVAPARVAVLERSLCRWPAVVERVLRRSADRSHALARQLAITELRRADDRVLALFEALADRWGHRLPEGTRITIALTHEMIATLVGVHRPSVSTAVHQLQAEGRLRRLTSEQWLLAQPSPVSAAAA